MGEQEHSKALDETVERLSDERSYKQLFHTCRDEEALLSGKVLKEIVHLCRTVLFPGYYGNAKISKQTIRFHTGVHIRTLDHGTETVIGETSVIGNYVHIFQRGSVWREKSCRPMRMEIQFEVLLRKMFRRELQSVN